MQTFLSFESSNDDQIIESSENELATKILQENQKYVLIDGPKKSGKSLLAKKFSRINNKKIIYDIPLKLEFDTGVYLDLNSLPLMSENFFHFLQYFVSNNLSLTIFSSHSFENDLSNLEVIPDILSRLKLFTLISINPPQDQLLFQLIEKFLKNKSISVQPKIIHHIMNFIERTYVDAFQAAEAINHLLYENNHNINLSLISEYYEQIQRPLS
ncbi:Bacterial dnaA protein [alpha proteobacterium HIMB59]|nr:Bacterial dnaA protein [alpha proteobacterium HIMB59]